jgi:hypothetical protein
MVLPPSRIAKRPPTSSAIGLSRLTSCDLTILQILLDTRIASEECNESNILRSSQSLFVMLNWHQVVRLPESEMNRLDVAVLNLACASGLPGADRIDWKRNFEKLDEWADRCKRFTEAVMPHFHQGRCDYRTPSRSSESRR